MKHGFSVGQRWLSEAEPELGLGEITAADDRQIQVVYAATDETRHYAVRNAPLVRVHFDNDDVIEDQRGESLKVIAVLASADLLTYRCEGADGRTIELPESELNARMRLNRPQDKLLARRLDPDVWFSLRFQAWQQTAALWRSPVFGLRGPRVDLIPHQLYVATEVSARAYPRVLLADEVGLGKTIEAGLILHRLILTGRVKRVLIVVPDALLHQWLVEMLRRFNLKFALFDAERYAATTAQNPFQTEQRVLCSQSLLTADGAVARSALAGEWDMLIVDEAHHLTWSEHNASLEYQIIEALAATTPRVLLLTATPEQLGRDGHFGRLRLLDPERFHDYQSFLNEEADYAPVAQLASRMLAGQALDATDRTRLTTLLGGDASLDKTAIIEQLIDRHGTGRVLFRNTRHAITGFPARELNTYALPLPAEYRELATRQFPEQAYGHNWPTIDPRVTWLEQILRALAPAKLLVICALADTAVRLREHLLARAAIHVAIFHEGMEIVARDRAAAFFADVENGAQALICSEIGSEGRNFQFAHHLVLFDLPLEADLLEQRIGRLDRIGQTDTIQLHVPYLRSSASESLMRWYRDGLGAFTAINPAAQHLHHALVDKLIEALAAPEQLPDLIQRAATMSAGLQAELEAGRDRLLELHSYRPKKAAALIREFDASAERQDLEAFITTFWDAFGVEHEPGPGHSTIVRPGSHMRQAYFPELPEAGATVTLARADALAHEDRLFMTWEHPMVLASIELLTTDELGSAAITVCSHPRFRTGTLFMELLFITECLAPPELELQRFLPPTVHRLVLDAKGVDRAAELAHDELSGLCVARNKKLTETIVKSQGRLVKALLVRGETLATERSAVIAAGANSRMQNELGAELARLKALAQINPNVRRAELEQLELRREQITEYLCNSRVRLDALRLVVMR